MEIHYHPEGAVPDSLLDQATIDLEKYAVLFAVEGRASGSGSLVTLEGKFGIVTAAHVIDDLICARGESIELVITTAYHRLSLEKATLAIRKRRGERDGDGPDLAFIGINDPNALSALKAKKSFYRLPPARPLVFDQLEDRRTALCLIAGGPAEMDSETGKRMTPEHVLMRSLFFGRAQVVNEWRTGGYDFLEVAMFSGQHGFPSDYGGVSGGGIWHIPLAMDPDKGRASLHYLNPELIGVAFYQSPPVDGARTIRAHGHRALAGLLQ
jgi:hypothetical protein